MTAQLNGTGLSIRPVPAPPPDKSPSDGPPTASPIINNNNNNSGSTNRRKHKHTRSSYSEPSPLVSRNNSLTFRPAKRHMPTPDKTIAVINASGRQAASLIRVATVLGYTVRAQLRNREGVVAAEVASNPNVQCVDGELYTRHAPPTEENSDVTRHGPISGIGVNKKLIAELFRGAHLAFVNTTFYGDEIQIGKAIADAAKTAGVQHFIYSSMPDHAAYDGSWPSLPLWAAKHEVEEYVRSVGLPATFVYTGIYNNNFTSLPYPLFCMELQPDGSFVWQAPFHEDAKLPWLDAEHDVGPAIYQIFKEGVGKWGGGRRVALAYEMLTPREACRVFSRGVERPVRYVRGPVDVRVPVPAGYRQQLEALEKLFYYAAPPKLEGGREREEKKKRREAKDQQPPYFGDAELEARCPAQALELWEGPRGLEEYAREIFPLEEYANGRRWMVADGGGGGGDDEAAGDDVDASPAIEDPVEQQPGDDDGRGEDDDEEEDEDGLVMRGLKRDEEAWLA